MATLTIRNVSEKTLERLKERARRNGRSMQKEVLAILEQQTLDRREVVAEIDRLNRTHTRPTTAEEVDEWIRKSRP